MSLFDDNYEITMEAAKAKAKAVKEEDDDDVEGGSDDADGAKNADGGDTGNTDDKGDDGKDPEAKTEGKDCEDPEEKLTPEEESAIEYAVDSDINAATVEEANGFDSIIASDVEEAHYACIEAVSSLIAFDQSDVACTEAYKAAGSEYEKQVVTEGFKDSVKKFGARFKAFLIKIKNAIVRIFNKAVNYIKILASRISAKFASRVKLDKSKKVPAGIKVRIADRLTADFKTAVTNVFKSTFTQKDPMRDIREVISILKDSKKTAYDAKVVLGKIEPVSKKDILDQVMPQGWHEVELASLEGNADKYMADLKTISKNVDVIKEFRKEMEESLKNAEASAKGATDIDTTKLNVLTACINKSMACFNAKMSAAVSMQSMWINQRVRIIRALAKHQGGTAPKETDPYDKYEGMHESANLFDEFLSML